MADINKSFLEKILVQQKPLTAEEQRDPFFPILIRLLSNLGSSISLEELDDITTGKRLKWFAENYRRLELYKGLDPIEKAYRFIFLDHLHIKKGEIEVIHPNRNKIITRSHNWCPYLAACVRMGLNTRDICKGMNENSFQAMATLIDPHLIFGRNYEKIRPYSAFCEEFIEYVP